MKTCVSTVQEQAHYWNNFVAFDEIWASPWTATQCQLYEWHHPGTTKTHGLKNPSPMTATNIFARGVQGVTVHHPTTQDQNQNAHYSQVTSAVMYVSYS